MLSKSLKKQPLISLPVPDLPYERVAADILDHNKLPYLVVVDLFSKWIDAVLMPNKTPSDVIDVLSNLFSIHCIPEYFHSDNVPFLAKIFLEFSKHSNFKLITCSPHHHQSNGQVEKACSLARKSHSIPGLNASPSQLLMSRQLRTRLPISTTMLLKPNVVLNAKEKLIQRKEKMEKYYNRSASQTVHKYLVNDYVYVQNPITKKWEADIILEICSEPRSYLVQTTSSNKLRRNSVFLQPRSNPTVLVPETNCTPVHLLPNSNDQPAPIIPVFPDQPNNQNNHVPENVIRTRTRVINKPIRFRE
ncbi:hypothetical protein FOCC_FOCC008340 [Frankliniella occidentalis]|nr:hypothetical protein FOCC_FOCC008340 [Frankliniella occidentalis]